VKHWQFSILFTAQLATLAAVAPNPAVFMTLATITAIVSAIAMYLDK
jgi:hypothetical protein